MTTAESIKAKKIKVSWSHDDQEVILRFTDHAGKNSYEIALSAAQAEHLSPRLDRKRKTQLHKDIVRNLAEHRILGAETHHLPGGYLRLIFHVDLLDGMVRLVPWQLSPEQKASFIKTLSDHPQNNN